MSISLPLHEAAWGTHRSASLVVMNVHLLTQVPTPLARVHELAGELEAVADIVRAPPPLPVEQTRNGGGRLRCPRLVAVVTRAGLNTSLAARPCYCVRHPRAGNGVDEGRFSTTCNSQWHIQLLEPFSLVELIHRQ
jgi:hypothetical protein